MREMCFSDMTDKIQSAKAYVMARDLVQPTNCRLAKSPKKLITSILFNNLPNCYCILPNRQLPPQSQQELPNSVGNSHGWLETPKVGCRTPKVCWETPKVR